MNDLINFGIFKTITMTLCLIWVVSSLLGAWYILHKAGKTRDFHDWFFAFIMVLTSLLFGFIALFVRGL
jgi:hypothetical protein